MRPSRLLDLFCGAGGCAVGYSRAGFDVVGVDIQKQPRYPFAFIQGDAIDILHRMILGEKFLASDGRWYGIEDFSAIHSSPPCQFGSEATPVARKHLHHNYIPELRDLLLAARKPFVIENVEGSRKWLINPVMICGSMFGLPIWRHRYFETYPLQLLSPATCNHQRSPITVHTGSYTRKTQIPVLSCGGGDSKKRLGHGRKTIRPRERVDVIRWAMGIDWMTQQELYQAIPPIYLEWLGKQMIERMFPC